MEAGARAFPRLLGRSGLPLQLASQPLVVAVLEGDELALGQAKAGIASARSAAIDLKGDVANARVRDLSDDLGRVVARTVVNNKKLEVPIALVQHAHDGARQGRGAVEGRENDANQSPGIFDRCFSRHEAPPP